MMIFEAHTVDSSLPKALQKFSTMDEEEKDENEEKEKKEREEEAEEISTPTPRLKSWICSSELGLVA